MMHSSCRSGLRVMIPITCFSKLAKSSGSCKHHVRSQDPARKAKKGSLQQSHTNSYVLGYHIRILGLLSY